MKAMKGIKFEFMDGAGAVVKLWHNFDKSPAEQLVSCRTTALVTKVKEHLIAKGRVTVDTVREYM